MEQVFEKKQIKFILVKYFFFAFCFLIFFDAKIFSLISPFAPAMLFALVWCGSNIWFLSLSYLACSLKSGFLPETILANSITVLLLILFAIIQKKSKKKVNRSVMSIYLFLSQLGKLIFVSSTYFLAVYLLEIVVSILLFLCYSNFFEALLLRVAKVKFNTDELFCAGVFLLSLSCASANLSYFGINVGLAIVLFLTLVFLSVLGYSKGMVCALLLGVGYFLATQNVYFLSLPMIFALVCGIFTSFNKYVTAVVAVLALSVLGFYFGFIPNFSLYQFAVCTLGIILYLFIKKTTIISLKQTFLSNDEKMGRAMINLSRKVDYFKFYNLGETFSKLDEVYKGMIKDSLSKEESAYMLSRELQNRMCSDCPNKKVCFRESGKDMLNEIYDMFLLGLQKKEINLIDLPSKLSSKCENTKKILAMSNSLLSQYVKFDNMTKAVNSSKIMVAEQMSSIAGILKNFAESKKNNLTFNAEKEKELFQNLVYSNITMVSDVCVAEENERQTIIISGLNEIENTSEISKVISKTMKKPFEFAQAIKDGTSNSTADVFVESAKCDMVFGIASEAKNGYGQSGDVHSVVKISPSKFILGLCDGMGSGEKANETSDKTISLIESYYRAGFSTEQIISNINKLYSVNDDENYSALDLCVLDLEKLNADFIKLGSPQTYIKRKNETKTISGGALPVGASEKQKPKFTSSFVQPKDLIFMVSDGVADAFGSEDELSFEIASLKGNNPQELADKLLEIAKSKKCMHPDDMTVFVSRVYRKVQ